MQLTEEQLLAAYKRMRDIREFEDRLHEENTNGDIPGFIHLYSGEEAVAVGICENLTDKDYITSTHRGHGHCIAKGCDIHAMMLEIFGKDDGLCRGKGGSMHIADLDKGMLGANGIVVWWTSFSHWCGVDSENLKDWWCRTFFYRRWWFKPRPYF